MQRLGSHPATLIAAAFATFDFGARLLIAFKLGVYPLSLVLAWPGVFVVAFVVLSTAAAVRPDGLLIATPMVALATIGDVVAVRLAGGEGQLLGPPLFAMCAFVVTLALVPDTARLRGIGTVLGFVGVALIALPLLPGFGVEHGGQRAWISLGGFEVSPGELGRPLVLVGVAAALTRLTALKREGREWEDVRSIALVSLVAPLVAVTVHLLENDFGPALLLALALTGIVATAANRVRWFVAAVAGAVLALMVAQFQSDKVHDRIQDWLHPFRQVDGHYDQAALAHLALEWAGWHGVGLGGGRADAIPLASSDYVLAAWTLESGLIGLLVTMALFAWLLYAAWTFALCAEPGFPRLLTAGLTWLLTVLTLWTTCAVVGFLPLSGLPSPFVGSGGSNAAALGMIAALLCRTRAVVEPAWGRSTSVRGALWLTRLATLSAMAIVSLLVVERVESQRVEINRRADNPFRIWASQRRGPILTRDEVQVAYTRGERSLDTIERRYRQSRLSAIVGRVSVTDENGGGVEEAWRALLRCGGSGKAAPAGPAWASGATVIDGDPARCRPLGLRLSVDTRVQGAAARELGDRPGAIVVLDARTGGVLAAVGNGRYPDGPRSIAAFDLAVAPGSTFKIVTAAAVLAEGIDGTTRRATSYVPPSGRSLPNAGGGLCGGALAAAFASSCNSSFAELGVAVGHTRLRETATRFGFGVPTMVSGIPTTLSTLNLKRDGDAVAASAIGQGAIVATPLQMALVAATIANGGLRPQPTLVDGTCDGRVQPLARTATLDTRTARAIQRLMRGVTLRGTGRGARRAAGAWALKTGTAELPSLRTTRTPAGTAAWIVGYPTRNSGRVQPVLAAVLLPTKAHPHRSGSQDGVAVVNRLASTLSRAEPRRPARC